MTHKRPNWANCIGKGVIQTYPNAHPLAPGNPVEIGMRVTAKYGDSIVVLRIINKQTGDDFLAEIEFFEPVNVPPPADLKEGETVLIDKKHICWLHPVDK